MVALRLLTLLVLLLNGCVAAMSPPVTEPLRFGTQTLSGALVWSGSVVIDGTLKVSKGSSLTIEPGTEIAFVRRDADRDGLGDAALVVEGELRAVGTPAAPIVFRSSAPDPQPGDWLELRVDFSRRVELRYCEIRDSAYTLHAHFTRGVVEDCHIHHNIDGSRLGQANFVLRNNLIENNPGKGVNFRNSTVILEKNIIRRNGTGVFLFETDREFTISANNIYANQWNFRLGDFFADDVALNGNWWGTTAPDEAAATVFDRRQDPTLGRVSLAPTSAWIPDSGPRDRLALEKRWFRETGAFIDAPPLLDRGTLFVAGWDGNLYAFDTDGREQWQAATGDVVDAPLALDERHVHLQNWGRQVQARDRHDGSLRWTFDYPASRADDHRQGGVVVAGELLLVPAWNGTLYALRRADGQPVWTYDAGQPLRATPAVTPGRIVLASGAGRLTVLDRAGQELWRAAGFAPLLSTPLVTAAGPVVVDRDGTVSAFDWDGGLRWQRSLGERCFYAAPVGNDTAIFVATAAGSLWKLQSDNGTPVWRQPLAGAAYATPLLRDGRLYLGTNAGRLQVVDADSGTLTTALDFGAPLQGTPLQHNGILYFGGRDRRLHAIEIIE